MSELPFFMLLLYPAILWVLGRRFEGMSQMPVETARSRRTLASSIARRNFWTLFQMSSFLMAFSTNTRKSRWASFALPDEPKIDDLTLTCELRVQYMNASIEWFSLAIPACVRLSDLSAMKKWNCLSTLALSFLMKYIRFPLIFHPHNWTCRICVWSCYWAGIYRINENRSETVIIASFGAEPSAWFERWLS